MSKRLLSAVLLSAAVAAQAMPATEASAQDTLFIPTFVYRTGPYAPNGIPLANAFKDYFALMAGSKV